MDFEINDYGFPVETTTGVRCGNHPRSVRVKHANAAAVRYCYDLRRAQEREQDAEIAAERAYEHHLEDRGYWDDIVQRDWEDRNGVVQFDQAYRAACPELFDSWANRTGNLVVPSRGLFDY